MRQFIHTFLCFLSLFGSPYINAFPMGRCYMPDCETTPYIVNPINDTCFSIATRHCDDDTPFNCCQMYKDNLNKIVFKTVHACERTIESLTINGVRKGGGIYFEKYNNGIDAEYRLTALRLNYDNANGTVFCMQRKDPCQTWDAFCPPPCQYSVFDPVSHVCCATCQPTNPPGSVQTANPPGSVPPIPQTTNPPGSTSNPRCCSC